MDQDWLYNLSQDTAVIVPTRSLANSLHEQHSRLHIAQGAAVWEAPTILLWQDYLQHLWQLNRGGLIRQLGVQSLISDQQSLLLWTQIIDASRRLESELTLLNVQQTARAAQRSWRLMQDWQLDAEALRRDHVADIEQFLEWLDAYRAVLVKRGLLDLGGLQQRALELDLQWPFATLQWHCYDLLTTAQQQHNRRAADGGVDVRINTVAAVRREQTSHHVYANAEAELIATLQTARREIEKRPGLRINLVIPDLARRIARVRELARDVFYPDQSPVALMHQPNVYRFSLGEPLSEWPAIEAALRTIRLMRNRIAVTDLGYILRNRYLSLAAQQRAECRAFTHWLLQQRFRYVLVDQLPALYAQSCEQSAADTGTTTFGGSLEQVVELRQALVAELHRQRQEHDFAALDFADWVRWINDWLKLWGWQTETAPETMDSVQYQLLQRWQQLLDQFKALTTVQHGAGLARAIELLEQMAADAVFLPKAVASPIFISGVYEAIGRPAELTMLTGMSEQYPVPPNPDAFLPNRLLLECGYPDASPATAYAQVQRVLRSLLSPSARVRISYARYAKRDQEVPSQVSPLFRDDQFKPGQTAARLSPPVTMDWYRDVQGPQWPDVRRARGGAQIFVDQSQCAFKAFVTHQLQYQPEEEAEFGLDPRERGTVVHRMLQMAWQELGSLAALSALDDTTRCDFAGRIAEAAIADAGMNLNSDKQRLLALERQRLVQLLLDWFEIELKRPQDFQVVQTEQGYDGQVQEISFRFKIDRLDECADGRMLLVDYKTGAASRTDWLGERMRQPQLPLYALQLEGGSGIQLAGIAYAAVKQPQAGYVALAERELVNHGNAQRETEWQQAHSQWPQRIEQLAHDFKHGLAQVDPIDERVCQYCDLQPMCRIAQLGQLALEADDAD